VSSRKLQDFCTSRDFKLNQINAVNSSCTGAIDTLVHWMHIWPTCLSLVALTMMWWSKTYTYFPSTATLMQTGTQITLIMWNASSCQNQLVIQISRACNLNPRIHVFGTLLYLLELDICSLCHCLQLPGHPVCGLLCTQNYLQILLSLLLVTLEHMFS
jgi:hypothetical protein